MRHICAAIGSIIGYIHPLSSDYPLCINPVQPGAQYWEYWESGGKRYCLVSGAGIISCPISFYQFPHKIYFSKEVKLKIMIQRRWQYFRIICYQPRALFVLCLLQIKFWWRVVFRLKIYIGLHHLANISPHYGEHTAATWSESCYAIMTPSRPNSFLRPRHQISILYKC